MKVIKDFQVYLTEIEKLSRPLSSAQKKQLETILTLVLTLLVSLRQASKMGEYRFPWEK